MINVAINGYGTVGKRIACAVAKQDDMKIVGVTKQTPTYAARVAELKGFDLYADDPESFSQKGYKVAGTVKDLLKKADVVIDCSPNNGKENIDLYRKFPRLKMIFQGGEKHGLTDLSFVAQCNYSDASGKDAVRVVSCNTTGLCRTLNAIDNKFGIVDVDAVMIRRGPDPHNSKKGPVNAIVPVVNTPTHHGIDVQTVLTNLNIFTTAVAVPTTLMHTHSVTARLSKKIDKDDVIKVLKNTPRVMLFKSDHGFKSTADLMEFARERGHARSDLPEIAVWEDSISVTGNCLRYYQAVHQESDIVPENIDAIRAMFDLMDAPSSIEKTNKSLGIKH